MGEPTKYTNRRKQLLRRLMETIFNGEELSQFCADYFPAVFQRFTPEMTNDTKIELLIEYCARRGRLGKLVANIQSTKPEAYQAFVDRFQQTGQATAPTAATGSAPLSTRQPGEIVRNPEELLNQSLAGRYEIQEILDRGGVGVVFKAYDTKLELEVAIKIIDLDQVKIAAMRERVRQEVRTAMKLDHPGIVQVYDFGQADSLLYIIMEFIPGYNLLKIRDYFSSVNRQIGLRQILQIVCQICLTIDYMHQQRVLHPGTKPENILLKHSQSNGDMAWQPVLINLGLLRPHRETLMSQQEISVRRLTYTVSPELLLGHATDIRSDVYALGIILYDLVVGQPPFRPRDLSEAIRLHVEEAPPRPRAMDPTIPEEVEKITLRALAKDPAERFLSARGMAQALMDYLEKPGLLDTVAPPRVGVSIEEPGSLTVVPGESRTFRIILSNEGARDSHVQLAVEGVPEEWLSISPSTTTVPAHEAQHVELTIQPPRSPESRAGRRALTIQAVNQQDPEQIDEIKKVLTVAPYIQFESSLWPQEISADQITQVSVESQGNTTETFVVEPKLDQSISFKPEERVPLKLDPGESRTVDFQVASRRRSWVSDTTTQTFSLLVISPEDQTVTHSGQVTSHGSVTTRWLYGAILAMLLVLCVVASFYPIIFPPPDRATATANRETSQAESQQATFERATALVAINQTSTVVAGTVQATRTAAAVVQGATQTVVWEDGDDDRDGLLNGEEVRLGTEPNNRDTDGDGLFDGAEVKEFGTNPFNEDTDFDGVPDDEEIRLNLDPTERDTDSDGTPDSVDPDPGQIPTPTATITPNPTARMPIVRFANTSYSVDERQQTAIISVILDRQPDNQVSVEYETSSNTATAGVDYRQAGGTLVFDPSQTVQRFTIFVTDDDQREPDETLLLRLQNPRGIQLGSNREVLLTILDDDEEDSDGDDERLTIRFSERAPFLGFPRYTVQENQGEAIIEVVLSRPAPRRVTVAYATSDNTAESPSDYESTSGILVFTPGEQRQSFEVVIINDDDGDEGEEIINLILNNATGASIDTSRARLVILDND